MLPWPAEASNLPVRQSIYRRLLETVEAKDHYHGVNYAGVGWSLNGGLWVSSRLLYNPLDALQIQQPHLKREMDEFFYSNCMIKCGNRDWPTCGIKNAVKMLSYLGPWRTSLVTKLDILTTPDRLEDKRSGLIEILDLLASSPPRRDLKVLDFYLKIVSRETKPTKPASIAKMYRIEIKGLSAIKLTLSLCCKADFQPRNALESVKSCLAAIDKVRALRLEEPRDPAVTSMLVLSPKARRVDFIQALPLELRLKIWSEVCADLEHDFYKDDSDFTPERWSQTFHCPKPLLVSRSVIHDFHFAWPAVEVGFAFSLECGRFQRIHEFLQSIGADMLSRVNELVFSFDAGQDSDWDCDWCCNLLWLSNTLCHFSKQPHSTRAVSSIELKELNCTDEYDLSAREYDFDAGDVGTFDLEADILITLENEFIQVRLI